MKEASEVTYKGHVLIALAIPERGMYASMLITVESDAARSACFPARFRRRISLCSTVWRRLIADHCQCLTGRLSTLPVQKPPARPRWTNRTSPQKADARRA